MVVGVFGPVVVLVGMYQGGVGCGRIGWPVAAAVAALVATAVAYWLICCMRFRMKSGGGAPERRGKKARFGFLCKPIIEQIF